MIKNECNVCIFFKQKKMNKKQILVKYKKKNMFMRVLFLSEMYGYNFKRLYFAVATSS